MTSQANRQIHTTKVSAQFGQIVQEVATTEVPVIIQTPNGEQVAIISLRDLERLWPPERDGDQASEREQARMAR